MERNNRSITNGLTTWIGFAFLLEALVIPWWYQEALLIGSLFIAGMLLIWFKEDAAKDVVNKILDRKTK